MTLWLLSACLATSAPFRYDLMATTGLQERLLDPAGKETTIMFSDKSDPEALWVLRQLTQLDGVSGTRKPDSFHGVRIDQAILLEGEFSPGVFRTRSGPGMAEAENYRKFVLRSLRVKFPFSWIVPGKPLRAGHVETHFSPDSLFPDGLTFKGRKVDLAKYATGNVVPGP